MFSKQEASRLRQDFWTAFGKYMQPILSSEGEKLNWVNYKTGAKHIFFRMKAGKGASIGIELTHADDSQRADYYNRFLQLRSLLENETNEEWIWHDNIQDEHGKLISSISLELLNVNIFRKEDWPTLISFFKPRIMALDAFWNNVKHEFDAW